jgi:hypothetical protein
LSSTSGSAVPVALMSARTTSMASVRAGGTSVLAEPDLGFVG